MRGTRRLTGFTVVETTIAVAISAGLLLGVGITLRTTTRLAERSRMNLVANEENRIALERISNSLRGAVSTTLTGFDVSGVATSPQFRTATGANNGAPILSTVAQLQWQATAPVKGVANPGEVVLVQDGVSIRVAKRVPAGGFSVTQVGGGLLIHLDTFAPISDGGTSNATGDTFVRLRN